MTSSFLNHPVIPMTTNADSGVPEMLNTFSPLMSSMPCDMNIVNLRTIQSKVRSSSFLINIKVKVRNVFYNLFIYFLQVKVHKLFNKFHVESLTPASLSLMHSPPDARNISEINMSSMEINTFRIRLR
uniref:Uncharacterized protein n=1 Tax=Meleagris gallopavo TaxID=9103 RepID=A0A803Y9U4_MELGA